jgi:hypothetical protein
VYRVCRTAQLADDARQIGGNGREADRLARSVEFVDVPASGDVSSSSPSHTRRRFVTVSRPTGTRFAANRPEEDA